MKLINIALFVMTFIATSTFAQQTKIEILQNFLGNLVTIDAKTANQGEPLVTVSELVAAKAAKTIELTKENIKPALETAKGYKTALIIVGRHTIVKITGFDDCIQSGAWGTCMPKGFGYIQKSGQLIEKANYINNIIGVPDGQKRVMYLFDQ